MRPSVPKSPAMSDAVQPASAEMPIIDEDLIRGQVANALMGAASDLSQMYSAGYQLNFVRIRGDGAMFLGTSQEFGTRLYDMRLLSLDGTQAKLYRLSREGEVLELEPGDDHLCIAIGRYLGATVHQLYLAHVPEVATPTHPAPDSLQ